MASNNRSTKRQKKGDGQPTNPESLPGSDNHLCWRNEQSLSDWTIVVTSTTTSATTAAAAVVNESIAAAAAADQNDENTKNRYVRTTWLAGVSCPQEYYRRWSISQRILFCDYFATEMILPNPKTTRVANFIF
jgi:hypothetical protein